MAESSIFWDQLIPLIEEGKVVPVVGQDLLTVPESTGHKLLYPFLAERLAKYLRVSGDDLPSGAELNEVACRYLSKPKPAQHIYAALKTIAAEAEALPIPEPLLQLAAIRARRFLRMLQTKCRTCPEISRASALPRSTT